MEHGKSPCKALYWRRSQGHLEKKITVDSLYFDNIYKTVTNMIKIRCQVSINGFQPLQVIYFETILQPFRFRLASRFWKKLLINTLKELIFSQFRCATLTAYKSSSRPENMPNPSNFVHLQSYCVYNLFTLTTSVQILLPVTEETVGTERPEKSLCFQTDERTRSRISADSFQTFIPQYERHMEQNFTNTQEAK